VELLIGEQLQAEAAADDLLHDLGGAAEDRLETAELPEPTIADLYVLGGVTPASS